MRAEGPGGLVAWVAVLAFVLTAVGPCLCVLASEACDGNAELGGSGRHACCQETKPGLHGVSHECCDADPDLVAAATNVPEIAPPALLMGLFGQPRPLASADGVTATTTRTTRPPALDRSPVLLI